MSTPVHRAVLLAALFTVATAHAQDDTRLLVARTTDTLHLFKAPPTREAWEARANELRLRVRIAAGLEPEPPHTPLHFKSYSTIDRGDYTVENVAFESLPGFFVTGNLYRPKGKAGVKHPGVLCPYGHWDNGRFFERSEADGKKEIERGAEKTLEGARYPLQARCAQLARMGCVVLHYDMVGRADSTQIGHGEGFLDTESMLYGISAFGLQTWDSIRALDALCELPDVDTNRIGCTGASGGGTQTFILCALDPRVKVAFPAVMVSNRMQGGCICENAPGLRIDTDNVEIAALFAPKPMGLTGANDWTLHLKEESLPELKKVWALYGKESDVDAWVHPEFDHNYNQVSREHMYAWMNEYLGLGVEGPIAEKPFTPIPPAELHVFTSENPRPASADAATVKAFFEQSIEEHPFGTDMEDKSAVAAARERLRKDLSALFAAALPNSDSIRVEEISATKEDDCVRRRLRLRCTNRPELCVAATLVDRRKPIVVVASSDAPTAESIGAREMLDGITTSSFLTLDLLGGFATDKPPAMPVDKDRNAQYAGYTLAYDRTLLAERVQDVLLGIAYAKSLGTEAPRLIGLGQAGAPIAIARAICGDAAGPTAIDMDFDFTNITSTSDPCFQPGILRLGGTTTVLGLCAPGPLALGGRGVPSIDVAMQFGDRGPLVRGRIDPGILALWWAEQ